METLHKNNLTGENEEGIRPNEPLTYLTASSVMQDKIINPAGEKLGDVKDVMLNVREGKIDYIVMQSGGFLGIGEKLFAIPYRLLRLDTDNHAFVFNQDKETIKNAPGFDKDHWPKTNNHNLEPTSRYWGDFMGVNTGTPY